MIEILYEKTRNCLNFLYINLKIPDSTILFENQMMILKYLFEIHHH